MEIIRESSFGRKLSRTREEAGIDIRKLSDTTKIQTRYIEALEAEEWSRVPAGVIGRGFVRLIAREIGANPVELVALYSQARGEAAPAKMKPQAETKWKVRTPEENRRIAIISGAVVLVVVLAITLLVWRPWKEAEPVAKAAETKTEAPAAAESQAPKAETHKLEIIALQSTWVKVTGSGLSGKKTDITPANPVFLDVTGPVSVEVPELMGVNLLWDGKPYKPPVSGSGHATIEFPPPKE